MPLLACFITHWIWIALLFSGPGTAQLTFDPTCYNVVINKGTSTQTQIDGSVLLDNAFDIILSITKYANNMLAAAIWDPNFALGNRQRVLELLVNFGLPQDHLYFHEMVNALIAQYYHYAIQSKDKNNPNYFSRTILCDSNANSFEKHTRYPRDYWNAALRGRPVTLPDGSPSWLGAVILVNTPIQFTSVGFRLCDEGILGFTNLHQTMGNWLVICPKAFTRGVSAFPQTPEDRAMAYYNLQFPQNHSDHYVKSLVGTLQHEMHHALFPGSTDVRLRRPLPGSRSFFRYVAYGFLGVQQNAQEILEFDVPWSNVVLNADTPTYIAIDLWLSGAEWSCGFALPWWLTGWRRAPTGLTNIRSLNKREVINSTAGDLVQADPAFHNHFQASRAGNEWLSD